MASEMGNIRLVLRSVNDETIEETSGVTPAELLSGVGSENKQPEPTPAPVEGPSRSELLALLEQQQAQRQQQQPPSGAPAQDAWTMVILEGAGAREVKFENGVPAADATASPAPLAQPNAIEESAEEIDGSGDSVADEMKTTPSDGDRAGTLFPGLKQ
jgi:hypothetical protein